MGQLCCLKKNWDNIIMQNKTKSDHDQTSKGTICFLN